MRTQRIEKLHETYMQIAELFSNMSEGIRAKVGAVIVTENGVLLPGFNGTPSGSNNALEYIDPKTGDCVTKPCVVHAELNCVMKAAKEGVSVKGSTVYVTHSPCVQCAAMLIQAGVKRVVYRSVYKNTEGIDLLKEQGMFTRLLKRI